jgi:hypothetical protein
LKVKLEFRAITNIEPRKRRNDLLNHSVGKILLLRIAAHVLERQHGDRGFVWECRGRTEPLGQRAMRSRTYSVSPDRLRDVLELLLAAILEANVQLAFDFAARGELILYLNRASRGGQGARKLGERAITRSLDKSPFVAGEVRLDQFSLKPFELGVGGFFSAFHKRGITTTSAAKIAANRL